MLTVGASHGWEASCATRFCKSATYDAVAMVSDITQFVDARCARPGLGETQRPCLKYTAGGRLSGIDYV